MRDYRSAYDIKHHLNTLSGVYFDGVDDKIEQEFTQTPNAWTFSVMSNHVDNANTIYLFTYCKITGTNIRVQVSILNSNKVFVRTMINGGSTVHTFDYVLEAGVWNHIVVTCDALEWVLYVDSFERGRQSLSGIMDLDFVPIDGDERIKIGTNNLNSFYSEGLMAHHTFFDRVLTQSEIYFITEHLGAIPPTAMSNVLHYQPLQYNSFKRHQIFNNSSAVVETSVNQIAHGFILNNVVVNDGGTYRLANLLDAGAGLLELRIVTNVIGVDDFEYATTGAWVAGFTWSSPAQSQCGPLH